MLGVPCNQFGGQEPGGSAEEIETFCSTTYGVSFPLLEKTEVNGEGRHPLYVELTRLADADGEAGGDVQWNFEKFLISPAGEPVARIRPRTEPDAPELVAAIEAQLPPRACPQSRGSGAAQQQGALGVGGISAHVRHLDADGGVPSLMLPVFHGVQ